MKQEGYEWEGGDEDKGFRVLFYDEITKFEQNPKNRLCVSIKNRRESRR